MKQIPISKWAKLHKINRTTAIEWARRGLIKATNTKKIVYRWYVLEDEKPPASSYIIKKR